MQVLLGFGTFLFKINICWKLSEIYFGYPRHPSFLWPFRMRKTISSFRGSQVLLAEGGGICDAGAMRASTTEWWSYILRSGHSSFKERVSQQENTIFVDKHEHPSWGFLRTWLLPLIFFQILRNRNARFSQSLSTKESHPLSRGKWDGQHQVKFLLETVIHRG